MIFRAFDPGVRVSVEAVKAMIEGMEDDASQYKAKEILARNGLKDLSSGKWFSQQNWLNAFSEISVNFGDEVLFNIGTKIVVNATWPDNIRSIHEALASIDLAYHMNHSPGKIGNYNYTQTGEMSGTMICDTPYPDALDRGIIKGTMCHFGLCESDKELVQIDSQKEQRSKGGLSTTYLISW